MSSAGIYVAGLSLGYGARCILNDIDFCMAAGKMLGIIGPNGAGKSTLLQAIANLIKPVRGKIEIFDAAGEAISVQNLRRHLSMTQTEVIAPPGVKAIDYALLGRFPWLDWFGGYRAHDHAVVDDVFNALDLYGLAIRKVNSLSAGEFQLLNIARALVQIWEQQSPCLLLDEPAANLDPYRRMELFLFLRGLLGKGWLVLVVMHDCNLAAIFCDEILAIKDGSQLFHGSVNKVLTKENLERLYDWPVGIFTHPDFSVPQLYFRFPGPVR